MRAREAVSRGSIGVALAFLGLGSAAAAGAEGGVWSVEAKAIQVEVTGHDAHVLDVRRPGGSEAIELETDAALGYGLAVLHDRGRWAYGLDFFIHRTDQGAGPLREVAAGAGDEVAFELPNRRFVSDGPEDVLYYRTLEDTTVELWVVDLYARRRLGAGGGGPWRFLFGVRNADFDNDYRAMAGIEDVGGSRVDASSNYSRMIGPLVGIVASLESGRHTFEADLRQSLVFGDIELSRTLRDFEGPPGAFGGPPEEVPPGFNQERLRADDSIEVPMTDLRLAWRVRFGARWLLGVEGTATAWWGLAVPPGVDPDRPEQREEADLVTYGVAAVVGFRF